MKIKSVFVSFVVVAVVFVVEYLHLVISDPWPLSPWSRARPQ